MNTVEFVQLQYTQLHQRIDDVLAHTTPEHFNWQPTGVANPIGATFLHMLNAEDFHIQTILQGQPRVWESEGWADKIGLAAPPGQGRHWPEARSKELDLVTLAGYQAAVRVATRHYLDRLTPEKLDAAVPFHGQELPVVQVLAALVIHLVGHAGEIAALKGVQGVKGLPF